MPHTSFVFFLSCNEIQFLFSSILFSVVFLYKMFVLDGIFDTLVCIVKGQNFHFVFVYISVASVCIVSNHNNSLLYVIILFALYIGAFVMDFFCFFLLDNWI